jgi:potassium-transporting ATPase KdpC subunit
MKTILIDIKNTIIASIILAVACCVIYPVVVWGAGQLLFKHQADGSLIVNKDGKIIGSELLGQQFSTDKYFNSRPSAAGTGYDGSSSGGTNLGPTSQKLNDSIKAAIDAYRKQNNLPVDALVPADAVTSSASGLDPHISPANARIQVARVAKARNLDPAKVQELVEQYTDKPFMGIIGDAGVNVLKLNLALDDLNNTK